MIAALQYLWMLFFVMIIAGIVKEHNLFTPIYSYIKESFKSNRLVLFLTSAAGGVLPIEGRVTVSAGVLDTMAHSKCRHKMGVVDYLSTHHYYLWSPLEKTVIIPMAALGMSYWAWLWMISPLIFVTLSFITYHIVWRMKEDDIRIDAIPFKMSSVIRNVLPFFVAILTYVYLGGQQYIFPIFGSLALYYAFLTRTWNLKKLLSYVRWGVLAVAAIVILLGYFSKGYESMLAAFVRALEVNAGTFTGMALITAVGFLASFIMGSSGKFIAMATVMTLAFGTKYFLWFFAVEYAGYLLSPAHKCVMIGNRYFGTPLWSYYKTIGAWCTLLLATAALFTFL
jgi:hypothetical protein